MDGVIGFTTMFAGNFAPKSWAFCQGQIIPIAQNTTLFSILGNVFGGDGKNTFQLPDLRSRRVIGADLGRIPGPYPYKPGDLGGAETITMSTQQMPAHIHPIQVTATQLSLDDTGNQNTPAGATYAASGSGYASAGGAAMKPYQLNMKMSATGMGAPYSILPAFMGMNYIICTYGVYPPRS